MHTAVFKVSPTKTYCTAQGTLLNVLRQPGWDRGLGESGYTEMWVSLFTVHLELAQHSSSAKPQYKVLWVLKKIKIRFKILKTSASLILSLSDP